MPKLTISPDDLKADRARALEGANVSRETIERLDRFVALLLQWQGTHNLVAPSTLPVIWTRHVADSLQLLPLAPDATRWIDLGSGGGFPGVVLACALADRGGHIDLVERNGKKAAFLREALRVTASPGQVHHTDIGDYVERFTGPVDCVTARALAPLKLLCPMLQPIVAKGAKALLLKGQDIDNELTEATKYWNIGHHLIPSRMGDGGSVLVIDTLSKK